MKQNDEFGKLLQKVRTFCNAEELLTTPGQLHLAVAVSGGADSMALLHLLLALRAEYGFVLSVCHVNHGLRGETANRDEAFVRESCQKLGVPVRVFHPAEVGFAVPPHAGEDWARRLRYACFAQLHKEGIDCIATAHTGTDQAETLLFRLARGTGLHGAAGIRPRRSGFCRPLLCLTRSETEQVCALCGQPWVTDETNDSDAYARNRLRHGALPALVSANAAAEQNLARFCEKAARADAYFTREAEALLDRAAEAAAMFGKLPAGARAVRAQNGPVWALAPLRTADPLILETALHTLTAPVRDAEEKYIRLLEALVQQGSGAVQLTNAVRFCAAENVLWQENQMPQTEGTALPPQPFFPVDGAFYPLSNGKILKIRVFPADFEEKIQGVHKKDLKNQADYAKITTLYSALELRCRRPGDRYRPAGRGVGKELRKWMNEAGVLPQERDVLPLLAAGSEVVWVCGAGFADGLAPDAETVQVLQLEPQKMEEEANEHE